MFKSPSAESYAKRQLNEARLSLIKAQEGMEYATAMVAYNQARVKKLEEFLSTTSNPRKD